MEVFMLFVLLCAVGVLVFLAVLRRKGALSINKEKAEEVVDEIVDSAKSRIRKLRQ